MPVKIFDIDLYEAESRVWALRLFFNEELSQELRPFEGEGTITNMYAKMEVVLSQEMQQPSWKRSWHFTT